MARVFLVDTNVLWNLALCQGLTKRIESGDAYVFISTLVHVERLRQIADYYGERFSIDVVRQFFSDSRFEMLPLSVEDAETITEVWLRLKEQGCDQQYWRVHRFDIVLCAIAHARDYTLITDDASQHFKLINQRMTTTELESWLGEW